jgi:hypothetical protein
MIVYHFPYEGKKEIQINPSREMIYIIYLILYYRNDMFKLAIPRLSNGINWAIFFFCYFQIIHIMLCY